MSSCLQDMLNGTKVMNLRRTMGSTVLRLPNDKFTHKRILFYHHFFFFLDTRYNSTKLILFESFDFISAATDTQFYNARELYHRKAMLRKQQRDENQVESFFTVSK